MTCFLLHLITRTASIAMQESNLRKEVKMDMQESGTIREIVNTLVASVKRHVMNPARTKVRNLTMKTIAKRRSQEAGVRALEHLLAHKEVHISKKMLLG